MRRTYGPAEKNLTRIQLTMTKPLLEATKKTAFLYYARKLTQSGARLDTN